MKKYSLLQQQPKIGFTLIELCITLAIVAFIAALCLPALLNYHQQQVAAQVHTLKTTCWYESLRARATNSPRKLTIDTVKNRYSDTQDKADETTHEIDHHLPPGVKFGVLPGIYGPPANPTQPILKPVTFVGNNITFYPEGASQAGSIYVTDQKARVQHALTIGVASTPYIRLYTYANNKWQPCT